VSVSGALAFVAFTVAAMAGDGDDGSGSLVTAASKRRALLHAVASNRAVHRLRAYFRVRVIPFSPRSDLAVDGAHRLRLV
jgi:hypothetical protein